MKTLKIITFILILLIGSKAYSFYTSYYTQQNLNTYKNQLLQTNKGKTYYNLFNNILLKYKDNKEVLLKLQNKIAEIETYTLIDEAKYSYELKNLIYYMDLAVYFSLDKLLVQTEDENIIENTQEDENENVNTNQDNIDTNAPVVFPGFSQDYDDSIKSIVAGEDTNIFQGKTSAKYESIDVGSVKFYISGTDVTNLENTIYKANLYLEGTLIKQATSSDIDLISSSQAIITFNNLENFIVPQKQVEFRLAIVANSIGYEKIGKTIKDIKVSKVSLYDGIGVTSGESTSAFTTDVTVENFSIVPGVPEVTILNDLSNSSLIKVKIVGRFGNNTVDDSNSIPSILLNQIQLKSYDNSTTTIYKLVSSADSSDEVIGVKSGNLVTFDLSSMKTNNKTISSGTGRNYEIYISNTQGGITMELPQNSINYDVLGVSGATNLNINSKDSLDLGYRNF